MHLHPIDTVNSQLLRSVLGREQSLFHDDWENSLDSLHEIVPGSRIMVIGAAGSIGRAFTKLLAHFDLAMLHLVDPNENNLVEVVRDLRSCGLPLPEDFKTLSIELGSEEFDHYVTDLKSCDYLINFSAMKHVRAERNPYTLSRLCHTNLFGTYKLVESAKVLGCKRVFSVSSDKSVNPANLMGATKAMMEQIMFASADEVSCSTARFANVAFSDGSLLAGFFNRFSKKQPFAAPNDVRRYFISHLEAAQLCMLSCFLGGNKEVFYPVMDESKDALTFSTIAEMFLKNEGYTPLLCDSEKEAIAKTVEIKNKQWPCLFSESDTSGEKDLEEFYFNEEKKDENRYQKVGVVIEPILFLKVPASLLISQLQQLKDEEKFTRESVIQLLIKSGLSCLQTVDYEKNLDQKM